MVVQHNLTAMNSNRMLGITQGAQAKSSEKLSSGYQINRAADDAAGLTISEKMRKQINGLDRASTNAEDGVSAVQTAEGALTEVHSMLQRMNELAVQAANGTNSESDRDAIQAEIEQLTTEIDRVAETTKFNETYLLKGNAAGEKNDKLVAAHDAGLAGKLSESVDGKTTFTLDKALEDGDKVNIAGKEYTIGSTTANTDGYKSIAALGTEKFGVGDSIKATNGKTYVLVDKALNADTNYKDGTVISIGDKEYKIAANTKLDATTGPELKNTDAVKMVEEALADGKEVYVTKIGTATGMYAAGDSAKVQIVSQLDTSADNTEVSSLSVANTATTVNGFAGEAAVAGQTTVEAGNIVTIKGVSVEATAEEPVAMSTIKDVVKQLKAGDEVTIGSTGGAGGTTFKIADKTDVANNEYTVDDVLTLLNDKDTVALKTVNSAEGKAAVTAAGLKTGTKYTAVESKVASDDENVISKSVAYKMMADELAKASSIGTDKAATVTSNNSGGFTITQGTVKVKDSLTFGLHVGADADMTNKITVDIEAMSAAGLGIKNLSVAGDTGAPATYAIDAIADAISKVSSQRSALGAVQNRLEHTIANLDNVVENTTAAESRIRDTDMASEMVEFSKNNILAQAGQSMLAQANQSTQGVLSLLG